MELLGFVRILCTNETYPPRDNQSKAWCFGGLAEKMWFEQCFQLSRDHTAKAGDSGVVFRSEREEE